MKAPLRSIRSLANLGLSIGLMGSVMAADIVGDPVAARQKVAMCIGCHGIPGYQASFPEVHKVPMIAGQNAKYIAAALTAYQKGERKHASMRGIAAGLSEQDIADLAAYYEAQGREAPAAPARTAPAPSPEVKALLDKGVCLSCHGEGMNKPIDASYPKLAGQHADYLFVALKAYQLEGNRQIGRSNAIMANQAKMFTAAELKAMSKYIASLPGDLRTVPQSRLR
jgi:cytochrome c553